MGLLRRYLSDEEGGVAEYAVLTGLVILLAIAIVRLFGEKIMDFLRGIFKDEIDDKSSDTYFDATES